MLLISRTPLLRIIIFIKSSSVNFVFFYSYRILPNVFVRFNTTPIPAPIILNFYLLTLSFNPLIFLIDLFIAIMILTEWCLSYGLIETISLLAICIKLSSRSLYVRWSFELIFNFYLVSASRMITGCNYIVLLMLLKWFLLSL